MMSLEELNVTVGLPEIRASEAAVLAELGR
jgi:hypothetical protein